MKPFRFEGSGTEHVICNVVLEVDFLQKKTFVKIINNFNIALSSSSSPFYVELLWNLTTPI